MSLGAPSLKSRSHATEKELLESFSDFGIQKSDAINREGLNKKVTKAPIRKVVWSQMTWFGFGEKQSLYAAVLDFDFSFNSGDFEKIPLRCTLLSPEFRLF